MQQFHFTATIHYTIILICTEQISRSQQKMRKCCRENNRAHEKVKQTYKERKGKEVRQKAEVKSWFSPKCMHVLGAISSNR